MKTHKAMKVVCNAVDGIKVDVVFPSILFDMQEKLNSEFVVH